MSSGVAARLLELAEVPFGDAKCCQPRRQINGTAADVYATWLVAHILTGALQAW